MYYVHAAAILISQSCQSGVVVGIGVGCGYMDVDMVVTVVFKQRREHYSCVRAVIRVSTAEDVDI